eukprot:403366869
MQRTKVSIPPGKTVININGCHGNDELDDHCGYCKGTKNTTGGYKWGITSHKMTVQDYQKLMDRGWRRCGGYYYKYDFEKSCCQPYTIRLLASEYQISHSQKKVMKRFNKFLLGEIDMDGKSVKAKEQMEVQRTQQQQQEDMEKAAKIQSIKELQISLIRKVLINLQQAFPELFTSFTNEQLQTLLQTSIISKPRDKKLKDTQSFSTNFLIKIFYKLKEEKNEFIVQQSQNIKEFVKLLKKKQEQWDLKEQNSDFKQVIEDSGYLTFISKEKCEDIQEQKINKQQNSQGNKKDQKINGVQEEEKKQASSAKKQNLFEEEKKQSDSSYMNNEDLFYQQYYKEHVPLQLKPGQQLKHKYTVKITKALSSKESFEIYAKYQEVVHGEKEKGISGYQRFLCQSPLFDTKNKTESNFECPKSLKEYDDIRDLKDEGIFTEYLGSYHMIHRIDGEIMAVGVVDFTPNVLSSVYLYYNPKFEFLNPGTFTAVREIEYVQRVQEVFNPEFIYYYMGYYFQDCQKSVYKASYKPSQVVCPVTYNYVYLTEEVKEKIAKQKKPLLCLDIPRIKEMDISDQQVAVLSKNFKFYYKNSMLLTINDLSPQFIETISEIVKHLYQNLGLDIIMLSAFTI